MRIHFILASAILIAGTATQAATLTATVNKIDATSVGAPVGTVKFEDTKHGLMIEPNLSGLPAGNHGMHIHEKGACGPGDQNGQPAAGFAAGGHLDPKKTGKHLGPGHADGHKGDVPMLAVESDGKATLPVLVPHLKVADLHGRSLMIHTGGDNYADQPAPLGGGGARIACAVLK